jgi:ABC-2 type transport system ATP-binding protein
MMTAAIEASGLGKQYRRTWALRDCTLAIPQGRVVGLVGPNGAGKTNIGFWHFFSRTPRSRRLRVRSRAAMGTTATAARQGWCCT